MAGWQSSLRVLAEEAQTPRLFPRLFASTSSPAWVLASATVAGHIQTNHISSRVA